MKKDCKNVDYKCCLDNFSLICNGTMIHCLSWMRKFPRNFSTVVHLFQRMQVFCRPSKIQCKVKLLKIDINNLFGTLKFHQISLQLVLKWKSLWRFCQTKYGKTKWFFLFLYKDEWIHLFRLTRLAILGNPWNRNIRNF